MEIMSDEKLEEYIMAIHEADDDYDRIKEIIEDIIEDAWDRGYDAAMSA